MKTASWMIVNKLTGESVIELFNPDIVAKINTDKYKAVPILDYLVGIAQSIKGATS